MNELLCHVDSIIRVLLSLLFASVLLVLYDCLNKFRESNKRLENIIQLCNSIIQLKLDERERGTAKFQRPPELQKYTINCFYCGRPGHVFYYCFNDEEETKSETSISSHEAEPNETEDGWE